jgi:hypothetical protein
MFSILGQNLLKTLSNTDREILSHVFLFFVIFRERFLFSSKLQKYGEKKCLLSRRNRHRNFACATV